MAVLGGSHTWHSTQRVRTRWFALPTTARTGAVQEADSHLDEHGVVGSHGQNRPGPRAVQSNGGHQAPQLGSRRGKRVGGKGSVAEKPAVPGELMQELVEAAQWRAGSGSSVVPV